MKKDEAPIIIEQVFNTSSQNIWQAITDAEQMRQWFFDAIPEFDPVVGFATRFDVQPGERSFPHVWKIIEVVTGKKIAYKWSYEGYDGDSVVTFELIPRESATLLRLTHEVLEDFQEDIPEFTRQSGIDGWKYFIQDSLKKFLEK